MYISFTIMCDFFFMLELTLGIRIYVLLANPEMLCYC